MRRALSLALVGAGLVSGCATPLTVGDIEGAKGAQVNVSVDAPPATVYRRLTERARECLQVGELQVQTDFYPDISTGRVSVLQAAIGWTLVTAKLEPSGTGTVMRLSTWDPAGSKKVHAIGAPFQGWARGEPGGECMADQMRPRPHADPSRP